jgi:neutral trehalase
MAQGMVDHFVFEIKHYGKVGQVGGTAEFN